MSKASVLALASELGGGQVASIQAQTYYDDLMVDIARQALFNQLEIVAAVRDTAVYTLPTQMSQILGVFYDDRMLSMATERELESVTPQWRDHRGQPVAYLIEKLSRHEFRLYPKPTAAGGVVIPLNGAPFGLDYPVDTIAVLASEVRQDLPEWMDLPLALIVLAREFARDSDHMDDTFAGACRTLGALFLDMVG